MPGANSVKFFDVEKSLFFDQKPSIIVFVKRPGSPKQTEIWNLHLWKCLGISTSKSAFPRLCRTFQSPAGGWLTLYPEKEWEYFLRISIKVILKDPRFVQNYFSKNLLRTCMQVFRQIRPIVFGRVINFVTTRHFWKMNCTVELSTLIKTSTFHFSSTDLASSFELIFQKTGLCFFPLK